ncbi:MAG: hypothetical protein WCL28_14355 [bacterium]
MKKIGAAVFLGLALMGSAKAETARDTRQIAASGVSGGAASVIFWNTMASTTALATAGVGVGVAAGVYAIYKVFDSVSAPAPAMVPTGANKTKNK